MKLTWAMCVVGILVAYAANALSINLTNDTAFLIMVGTFSILLMQIVNTLYVSGYIESVLLKGLHEFGFGGSYVVRRNKIGDFEISRRNAENCGTRNMEYK